MLFLIEHPKYRMIILAVIAFAATELVFWPLLRIARKGSITDNPDGRKLQKIPIPVLGGAAVFFGIMVGMSFFKTMHTYTTLFPVISAMVIMLYVGIIDDVMGVPAWKRLVIETIVGLLVIYGNRFYIRNFQGLWGIDALSIVPGIILSVITFVGIVNAINMMDGIDGLSSSFCIMICTFFGLLFFLSHDYSYAGLATVSIGAILPFFLHNVFGLKTKMFIGDGGTMVMGTMISSMVFELLRGSFHTRMMEFTGMNFSLIAFCLAVLAIPVADTVRVMTERIVKGRSPFSPDRRHLHHLFIDLNISYIFTTMVEVVLALLVIAAFAVSCALGASVDGQLYTVIAAALLADGGVSLLLRRWASKDTEFTRKLRRRAERTHVERRGIWLSLQHLVDGHDREPQANS